MTQNKMVSSVTNLREGMNRDASQSAKQRFKALLSACKVSSVDCERSSRRHLYVLLCVILTIEVKKMRLFSTPKTSPELVRHAAMLEEQQTSEKSPESMPANFEGHGGQNTPPRSHSPSLVRGVSTLGRKFSRRFEKFGESETARKFRMASPSRKYQFSSNQNSSQNQEETDKNKCVSVSRVDSFRNFFLSTSANLKTPRAVKRRSRNTEKHRSASQGKLVDVATTTTETNLKKKAFHRNHFGSELTLPDYEDTNTVLSECQSEADLRGFNTEDEADDLRSVVSDFQQGNSKLRFRSSSGNLAARLGILPENRTILDFKEAGHCFNTSQGLQIKTYGLIDDSNRDKREESPRKISHGQESGYGSDGATTNSSRASPRGSLEGDSCQNSVREKIQAFQNRENETPSPPTMTKEKIKNNPPLLMPKPSKSLVIPPKKPARAKKPSSSMIDVVVAEEDLSLTENENEKRKSVISVKKEYKMIRLLKDAEEGQSNELGIIIAKKKLPDLQPPVTGFQVVHIEPRGLIDR